MNRVLALILLLPILVCGACSAQSNDLKMPELGPAAYHAVAAQVFANETRSQIRHLTYWGEGEDFPSLGIGHFIWFPDGVDAPFDESFPAMVEYLRAHADPCSKEPAWLSELASFDAPWVSKEQFDAELQSSDMQELRSWLEATAASQARYIVASFTQRWNELSLPGNQKALLTQVLQSLLRSPEGLYAVIDYYNFKGLGTNPRERYKGEGWGLVQVLGQLAALADTDEDTNLLPAFSKAAADRLTLRVENSPSSRNEVRWLNGWLKRVAAYKDPGRVINHQSGDFRVAPYLQDPSPTSMSIVWFSASSEPGHLQFRLADNARDSTQVKVTSEPEIACALSFHLLEFGESEAAYDRPYRQHVKLDGLSPGANYTYRVRQGAEELNGSFQTPDRDARQLRFVVYADSETEPESANESVRWTSPTATASDRQYPVDQRTAYLANLDVIESRNPNLLAIAGDLVESGGEQRDWDEFWRMNSRLGRSVPVVAAPGNHEYFGGPGELGGYSDAAARRSIDKFKTYFSSATYRALPYGPALFVVLDTNAAEPATSSMDTNWYLNALGSGGPAPSWTENSTQGAWLERTLEAAQTNFEFIFVVFHHAPYSSGIHGLPPGTGESENFASGLPLQALTPLFMQYGVAAVFTGHDEHYEHSVVNGQRTTSSGQAVEHAIHYFTVGIGGDGLRAPSLQARNPYSVFLAHSDAPESLDDNGVLVSGGKHYGHLEINLYRDEDDRWRARFDPVYLFPKKRSDQSGYEFERRLYDDVTVIRGAHGWQR